MVNISRKSISLLFFIVGIVVLITSVYFQATTTAYVGLGIIFWGLIIGFIVTEIPSKRKDECSRMWSQLKTSTG